MTKKLHTLVPCPSETWFRGISVGRSFRWVWGRAHPQEMQPTGGLRDSACRLRRGGGGMVLEDDDPRYTLLPSSNLVPFGRWRQARGREYYYRGESDSALSGRDASDPARAEGNSITDEPGEC